MKNFTARELDFKLLFGSEEAFFDLLDQEDIGIFWGYVLYTYATRL